MNILENHIHFDGSLILKNPGATESAARRLPVDGAIKADGLTHNAQRRTDSNLLRLPIKGTPVS
jgi:hypothetical protein